MTIVDELRQDRERGARRLESEYRAGLLTLARRFCADPGDAEELVNRTFAAVVAGIDDYLEQSAFFGWMCQIMSNLHVSDGRRKSRQLECADQVAIDGAADDEAACRIVSSVDASLLREAIEELPREDKEVLLMHYFMDLPVARIARILSAPEGTVKWRLHGARLALGAKLGAVAKKPGGKALLIALALCGLTVLGAAVWSLGGREAAETVWTGETGGTCGTSEGTGKTGAGPASPACPARPASPSVPSVPSVPDPLTPPTQQETSMNKTSLLSTGLAMTALAVSAPRSGLADTIAHWDFGSDADGIADCSGNWHDLENGGVALAGGAAVFDGTVKPFHSLHPVEFSTSEAYTIECFVNAAAPHSGMILELSSSINDNVNGFYLLANEGVMARSSSGYNGKKFSATVCDGAWHHVAVVVDPSGETSADQLKLYVDRVEQTVQSQKRPGTRLQPYRLFIGSRNGDSIPFSGKIDDVRISRGALAPEDFLAERSTGTLDVRAYWKFDSDAPLADASGHGNALRSGALGVAFAGGCASFDGTASDVRTAATLDLTDTADATVEFFVRKHESASAMGMVLEHSDNYWNNRQGFYVDIGESRVDAVQGNFRFADSYRMHFSPANAIASGWHHVALVKDSSNAGTGNCSALYVDGILQKESRGSTASGAALRNDVLYIGSRANTDYFLDADVDDVRVTAQALKPWQFLRTRTGTLEETIAYWPFKAGRPFEDASGNGNALTGTGVSVSGEHALVLDGSQRDLATIAPLPLYPYDSLTVEWFMKSSMTSQSAVLETTSQYFMNAGAFGVFSVAGSTALEACFKMEYQYNNLQSASGSLDGAWHHYALVYDRRRPTVDIVRFYRDGEAVSTRTQSKLQGPKLYPGVLYIGARNGSDIPFVGELDDIRITGRALDPAEFLEARSMPQPFTLVIR